MSATGPSSAHIRDRYDREYYLGDCGGHVEYGLFHGRKLEDPRLATVHALAAVRSGDRVIDIGCGRGEVTRAFAVDGAAVTAIDYSSEALDLARETVDVPGVRFVCGDATTFADSAGFDVAVASDVIEHLAPTELDRLYANVATMLRPSGSLIVHTWPNAWMYRYGYPRRRADAALRGETWPVDPRTPYERAMHINEQSPNVLRRQLRAHFPHVVVWLGTADDPRGSLARRFTSNDARTATDVFAYASHRPIDAARLLSRITTGPLDIDDAAVRIRDAAAPLRVRHSEPFVAEVTLVNDSDATLTSFTPNPVRFAYLWLDEHGASVGDDRGRSMIAPAASPRATGTYAVRVVPPDRPGRFTLRLTIVQELVRWFSTRAELRIELTDA